jgi:hypothetical protein
MKSNKVSRYDYIGPVDSYIQESSDGEFVYSFHYDIAIKLLKQANSFLELFEAGQKRMKHDLNLQDTMDAVTLYNKIKKELGDEIK